MSVGGYTALSTAVIGTMNGSAAAGIHRPVHADRERQQRCGDPRRLAIAVLRRTPRAGFMWALLTDRLERRARR